MELSLAPSLHSQQSEAVGRELGWPPLTPSLFGQVSPDNGQQVGSSWAVKAVQIIGPQTSALHLSVDNGPVLHGSIIQSPL